MSISDWMPTMISTLGAITGLAASGSQPHRVRGYTDLPGAIVETPTMIVMPLRADHEYSAGGPAVWVHQVQATLYFPSGVLPEAYSTAIPYIKLVSDKMAANLKLGGLSWSGGRVEHWLPQPDAPFYQLGRVTYASADGTDREYLGIIFLFELKEIETGVTVTA